MAPSAPVVLRVGAMVFHINATHSLESVLDAIGTDRVGLRRALIDEKPNGDATHGALAMHERALQVARRHLGSHASLAQIACVFARRGRQGLAKRLRASARSRGALAHPDAAFADDLESALACGDFEAPPWSPESLRDDRQLRERPATTECAPEAVQPPIVAAPSGGGGPFASESLVLLARLTSVEKQMDMVLDSNQCESSSLRAELDCARKIVEDSDMRVQAMEQKFHEAFGRIRPP